MSLATLHDVTYAVTGGSVWAWSGTAWSHARTPGNDLDPVLLSDFIHPVTLEDHIVFGTFGGYLWKFDGKRTERLGIRTIDTPTAMGFTEAPIVIFEESEGRLLAVNENGDVLMSTDLVSFACIGKAPPDVRAVGSLDGVVYFGGAEGHLYAYEEASW
jgi:outer membrane protein assembly factor BamB